MVLLCYGQCTWEVAARIKQLGIKFKGRNGEKIPNINTMGNAQDMVAITAILGDETGSIPRAEVSISNHRTFVTYGHVSFVKEVYPDD